MDVIPHGSDNSSISSSSSKEPPLHPLPTRRLIRSTSTAENDRSFQYWSTSPASTLGRHSLESTTAFVGQRCFSQTFQGAPLPIKAQSLQIPDNLNVGRENLVKIQQYCTTRRRFVSERQRRLSPVNRYNVSRAVSLLISTSASLIQVDGGGDISTLVGSDEEASLSADLNKAKPEVNPRQSQTHTYSDLSIVPNSFNSSPRSPVSEPGTPLTQFSPKISGFPFPELATISSPATSTVSRLLRSSPRPSPGSPGRGKSHSVTSCQTPDRFIPQRKPESAKDRFKLSRSPDRLTDYERLVRSRKAAPDPFIRRIRSNTASLISRLRTHSSVPNTPGSGSLHGILGVRRNSTGSTGRRFSGGTVWNVGGSGAASGDSVYPIEDGRGGFTTSGSNAPLYSANFFTQIDPVSERDLHERRLALALDVDTSARVFSTGSFSSVSGSLDSSSDLGYVSSKKIVWKNNEWSKEGSTSRWFHDDLQYVVLTYNQVHESLLRTKRPFL
jgi:hypothetical protein